MKDLVHVTQMIGRQYAKSYVQQLIARGDGIVSDSYEARQENLGSPAGTYNTANHIQVGGDHYKSMRMGQQEHWDIVATHDLDYFQGQVTKYVMRWKKKGGLQDLKKGLHFLQKYVELVEGKVISDPTVKVSHQTPLRDGDQYLQQPVFESKQGDYR